MTGGFKRGGSRGGSFKKGFAKKRAPDDDDDAPRADKKSKGDDEEEHDDDKPVVPRLQTDESGDSYVAINHSGKRRVTVQDFKGTTLVSIREYWRDDKGDLKPGKKGISLSIEQYNTLLAAAPLLESVLSNKNIQVSRPDYDTQVHAAEPAVGDNAEEEYNDEDDEE